MRFFPFPIIAQCKGWNYKTISLDWCPCSHNNTEQSANIVLQWLVIKSKRLFPYDLVCWEAPKAQSGGRWAGAGLETGGLSSAQEEELQEGVWSWQRTCARPLSAPLLPSQAPPPPARPVPRRTAPRSLLAQWSEVWGNRGQAQEEAMPVSSTSFTALVVKDKANPGRLSVRDILGGGNCCWPVWRGCAIRPASGCKARFKAADYQAIYLEVWAFSLGLRLPGGGLLPHLSVSSSQGRRRVARHLEPSTSCHRLWNLPLIEALRMESGDIFCQIGFAWKNEGGKLMPPNFSHTDDFVEDLKGCVVQVTCARCCFLAQCSDEGMRTKLATADEKGINRGKEGRREWVDTGLIAVFYSPSPQLTPQLIFFISFSLRQSTQLNDLLPTRKMERCDARKRNPHAPLHLVLLEREGRECRDVGNTLDWSRHHCGSFGSGQRTIVMIAPPATLSQPSSLSRTNTNLIPINSTPDTITITKAIIITNVKWTEVWF